MSDFGRPPRPIRLPSDWRRWRYPALWAVVALVLLIAALSSFYTVETGGKTVHKRFGAVVGVREPGPHFKIPFGIDTTQFVPTERVLKEEFGFRTIAPAQRTRYQKSGYTDESLMLTGDLNVFDVEWVVQYRIADAVRFLHQVRNPEETIRDVSEAVMRQIVGNRLASDVQTVARVEIAGKAREDMQLILDSYEMGVHVTGIELQDVEAPEPVKDSFNEVNEARQQKERSINVAEKERNQVLPRAQGEAEQTVAEAEAYKTERINAARGESARFTAILAQYRQAEETTRQRLFLETMDAVAPQLGGLYVMGESTIPPLPLFDLQGTRRAAPAGARRESGGNER